MNETSETPGLKYVLDSLKRAADNSECWAVYPAESGLILAEVERLRELLLNAGWPQESEGLAVLAQQAERAAVVAWLRDEVDAAMKMRFPVRAATFLECADAIERGDHRREGDE